jgi:hypothetical protein
VRCLKRKARGDVVLLRGARPNFCIARPYNLTTRHRGVLLGRLVGEHISGSTLEGRGLVALLIFTYMVIVNDQMEVVVRDHCGSDVRELGVVVQDVFEGSSGDDCAQIGLELDGCLQLVAGVRRKELHVANGTAISTVDIEKNGHLFGV